MTRLHTLILRTSRSLGAFLALALAFGLLLIALLRTGDAFARVTSGYRPFDLQNGLGVENIATQLPLYTDASRRFYALFALFDAVFPLVGGLMTAAAAAFLTGRTSPVTYARIEARRGFLAFMLPTLFDWLENIVILVTLFAAPPGIRVLWGMLVAFKKLKLASLAVSQVAVLSLAVSLLFKPLAHRAQRR
jgi:hypothetical protein